MKRAYDTEIVFTIETSVDIYQMFFTHGWSFQEMLDFMVDHYDIDLSLVTEITNSYVRKYKIAKDV